MGVPKFFRYICKRYPCIKEQITEDQIQDIDNFYLDMNGIIHVCCYPEGDPTAPDISEEEMFKNIFHFLDVLVYLVKPRKLIFLAVDGVAPRAKMNQQRGRRFRSAKEKEMLEKKLESEGASSANTPRFDRNCITPGTEFMLKLQSHLQYFLSSRISNNPSWKNCKVILSGHEVPGEGEHKIVEFIRYMKTLPDYDPYIRHCFYGSDADLLILGLCTHEQNFSVLRQEAGYGPKKKSAWPPEVSKFILVHLSLLKEYLDLEFMTLKTTLPFEYNLENIVDDWVLMGFILGNDFIPHLPDFHIDKGALPLLYKTYAKVLPTLNGYLNENGYLNLERFHSFVEQLAKYELESFEENYANLAYLEEKLGRKLSPEKNKENEDARRENEVEAFNVSDDIGFIDDELTDDGEDRDCEDDEDDEDDFYKQFWQHKRNYYADKLECPEITEEVLKSQAEGYVRGLQWILHYYYHGCRSWSWCYPHHYAPCTSDMVNFRDVNLDFELGKPFLPYQQLLAVLPPASKDLVPKAYHNLMTSPNSPLKAYYPEDFETDLNGKQNDWEAVVLLPIIDEKVLLDAMEECDADLTLEEKENNKHGPMLEYSYTDEDLGLYVAPKPFDNIKSNHASVKCIWRDEVALSVCDSNPLKKKSPVPDVFFPKIPTFKFMNFEVSRRKGRVKPYERSPTDDGVLINITEKETPGIGVLVNEFLGKTVYIDWPYLTEARVVAIADESSKYIISNKGSKKYDFSEEEKLEWVGSCSSLRRKYLDTKGIEIGDTKVLLYVNKYKGIQQTFDSETKLSLLKVWSETIDAVPLQTVVKQVKVYEPFSVEAQQAKEPFPVDSVVFMLGYPYYGCKGRVGRGTDKTKNGRLPVTLEIPFEHKIDRELLSQSITTYYSASMIGQKMGLNPVVVGRISGHTFVDLSLPGEILEKKTVVNIGLALKFNKTNQEVPGYTKKETYWKYSTKAINVMKEYVARYPHVVNFLSSQPTDKNTFFRQDILPDPKGGEEITELLDWIRNLECSKVQPVSCGSQLLEKDIILEIEKTIDNSPAERLIKNLLVKPQLLFKSDLISNGLPPVPSANHQLFDRVISIKPAHTVPLGLRGYIVGIHKADNPDDYMYDILYDESFPGGMTINCSPGRGYRTSKATFLNISHGERTHQPTKQSKSNRLQLTHSKNSSGTLTNERPSSAFALWNNCPPNPVQEDKADQFKMLWSYLEKVKSQDETKVLKKLLKIEDEEKPKDIEDNVKMFFENVSRSAERMIPRSSEAEMKNVKEILEKFQHQSDMRFHAQLVNYFQSRNLPQPTYQLIELGNKIMYQVALPDGRVYMGFPRKTEDCARDSAALQVLTALGIVQQSSDQINQKETEKTRRIMENQAKLEKGLFKSIEIESSKTPVKSKTNNEKSTKNNKSHNQNQRKNDVPQTLPTPPLQWCRQYKSSSSHADQYKGTNLKCEDPKAGRIQNENINHNWRSDVSNNSRNINWRQEDKPRNHQSESRMGNDLSFSRSNCSRQRQPQSQSHSHGVSLRPDIYFFKSTNQDKTPTDNIQAGTNGACQRLSAVATEFIPLQALTRSRNRGAAQTPAQKQTKVPEKAPEPDIPPLKSDAEPKKEKVAPPLKQQRKSKIAAKFDADWD